MIRQILLYIFLISGLICSSQNQEERPSILWIVSEDNSPLLGCYGDPYATTPNIDRFAENSILYENAFSTAPACAPSRATLITGMYASSLGIENMRSSYTIPDFVQFFPKYLREAGYYTTNNAKEDYNTPNQPQAWDESNHKATYKNRKPGQPFFSVYNIGATHESKIHRQQDNLNHDPNKVKLPPYHPATPEMKQDRALFYDNIERMDKVVGEILTELEDEGLAENTIVFYYSDHGGVLPRSKRYIFDSGLRVPLIIHIPEKFKHMAPEPSGSRTSKVVSFEDFAPTVLNLANVKIPDYMEGSPFLGNESNKDDYAYAFRGRIDERVDFVRSIRNKKFRYVRNFMPNKIYGQHVLYQWQAASLRSWEKAFKADTLNEIQSAFWKEKPSEELYDISQDPYNIHNLAKDESYSEILKEMREDTREIILDTRDTGFIPESMKEQISETGTIYEFARSEKYPLEKILETAEMATSRDSAYIPELNKRLKDENSLVRYWATIGCKILGIRASQTKSNLEPLLEDPAPEVRIEAAAAIYKMGDHKNAIKTLKDLLENDNLFVRLNTLTVLEEMGGDAYPALPEIMEMAEKRMDKKVNPNKPWTTPHDVKIANGFIKQLSR